MTVGFHFYGQYTQEKRLKEELFILDHGFRVGEHHGCLRCFLAEHHGGAELFT
jgi:hypothetical protein